MPSFRLGGKSPTHMNSLSPSLPAWARLARGSWVVLLPMLASAGVVYGQSQRGNHRRLESSLSFLSSGLLPYLAVVAPTPLRFQSPPPTDLTPHALISAPPRSPETSESAIHEAASTVPPADTSTPTTAPSAIKESVEEQVRHEPEPLPILPDDTPREVSPRDVIPFFQFPGAPTAPVPGAQPPSSATYRLK